ncbi:MAG: mRNA surveillance protein pelota [archaeon]|nr:mRNA surveillance protein pelota [archaeon]
MRIKGKFNLVPFGDGSVDIIIDELEDLWSLYNILSKGDYIKTAMFRKIQHESGGKVQSTKKKLILTIKVEEISYEQMDGIIRVKGKNMTENNDIAIGQYQTCEITKHSFFSLYKKFWDDVSIDTLKAATDTKITADVASVIMEEGVAHLFYITKNMTTLQGKVTQNIPKKRNGPSGHDKSKKEFFSKILNQLVKPINFENIKCVIVASPGFTKDEFGNYMTDEVNGNNKDYLPIKKNLSKFIYVHSSSGYKQSLEEILTKQEIKKLIKDTQCIDESNVIEKFNETLAKEMDKVFFGLKSFNIACEKNAISTVIFSDGFLRKLSPTIRKAFSPMLTKLKNSGVEVYKLSSQHVGGEKIDSFGGIVGILNYPLEELAEIGMDDLEVQEENEAEDDQGDFNNENLKGMMENNYNYNEEIEESKKEEPIQKEKGGKKKGNKKGGQGKKEPSRKRSSFDEDED